MVGLSPPTLSPGPDRCSSLLGALVVRLSEGHCRKDFRKFKAVCFEGPSNGIFLLLAQIKCRRRRDCPCSVLRGQVTYAYHRTATPCGQHIKQKSKTRQSERVSESPAPKQLVDPFSWLPDAFCASPVNLAAKPRLLASSMRPIIRSPTTASPYMRRRHPKLARIKAGICRDSADNHGA